jgi:hypothetical protein
VTARPKLLYILAPSYSGSTLLTYLLSQHGRISTIGESKATGMGDVDRYRCSCGELIRSCKFWTEVANRANAQGAEFSVAQFGTVYHSDNSFINKVVGATVRGKWFERLRAIVLGVTPEKLKRTKKVTQQNFTLSQIICELQGGDIFLDGSKDSARLLHFTNSGLWDVKIIYLQRDGRGVSNSYRRHGDLQYDKAVDYWRHTIQELEHMRRRLDEDAVFDLHYEDLCKQPEQTMSQIWKWLNIEDQAMRELDVNAGESHILGNNMRLKNVSEIRFDEKWKSKLSGADLGRFEINAGDLNRQLGYQ